MKLLILTQKVDKDDPILGFFHRWIQEFAKHFSQVTVICLERGQFSLPENIRVLSLGKEEGVSRLEYVSRFYKYIWNERKSYDAVFVHMNPEYVVLGGSVWKILRKKIGLWYVHRQSNLKLKLAEKFADVIFTATKDSFTIPSTKLQVLGHGIDVGIFLPQVRAKTTDARQLLQIGRITRIKHCETAIEALALLPAYYHLRFIGNPVTIEDQRYFQELKSLVVQKELSDRVKFAGSVAPQNLPLEYASSDLTLNLTPTGGVDKVVLESMAAGVPVIASNQTFRNYFGEYADELLISVGNAAELAEKIKNLQTSSHLESVKVFLRKKVEEVGSLEKLIDKISSCLL